MLMGIFRLGISRYKTPKSATLANCRATPFSISGTFMGFMPASRLHKCLKLGAFRIINEEFGQI